VTFNVLVFTDKSPVRLRLEKDILEKEPDDADTELALIAPLHVTEGVVKPLLVSTAVPLT
jgi:hypothetical protein